ncbi:MAG TPA: PKD domain-containing protein, partial [Bacteroidia bacterium]
TTTGNTFTLLSNASGTARIAPITGSGNIAGNIKMQRYSGTGPTDWRFLCSPVSGTTIADWAADFYTSGFTGSTGSAAGFISIYWYDETQPGDLNAYGYTPATNVTNPIVAGRGYLVYLGPTPVTFDVTGPPYKFAQSPSVTYTNSGNILNDGWNLIANPYPSAIDWDDANWAKSHLDNAVYIYNSYTGSYASYVAGVGVNGGSNFIPSSQAFWVKANAASPSLSAVENVKATADPAFLKSSYSPNTSHYPMAFHDFPIPYNTNLIPNSIRLTGRNSHGKEDETFVRFMNGASADFDSQYDAWKMSNLDTTLPNLATVIHDTSDLAINSLSSLTSDITIKIRYTVSVSGTYSIRRDSILMLPLSSCVMLEDLANGNMIDLRSTISYSFNISDTTKAPRFVLHISAPIYKQASNASCSNDSSGMAIAKGTGAGPWNYVWKNSAGTILQTKNNLSSADTLKHIFQGIYTVQVTGGICGTVSDTIQIRSSSTLSAMANYSNVSCYGKNDGSAYSTVNGGVSPFNYYWSNGATTSAINNLAAGNYSVTVTDAGGCSNTQFVIISQPAAVLSGFTSSADTIDLSVANSVSFTNTSSGANSYQWNFGDLTLADTAKNPVHHYSSVGTYTVTLTSSSGICADSSHKVIAVIFSNPTAVHEQLNNSSVNVIYDGGDIYLEFNLPEAQNITIAVYDLLGNKILSQQEEQVQYRKVRLQLYNVPAGVYISVSGMDTKVISKKIIKAD